MPNIDCMTTLTAWPHWPWPPPGYRWLVYIAVALSSGDKTLNSLGIAWFYCCEIHQKVFIYVYLQFKSWYKENYLALTSLKIPLTALVLMGLDSGFIFHFILQECGLTPTRIKPPKQILVESSMYDLQQLYKMSQKQSLTYDRPLGPSLW